MRRFLQHLLTNTVIKLADKFSSRPDEGRVDKELSDLHKQILSAKNNKGIIIPFDVKKSKFIILSDQHKGARDGADIFKKAEGNYLAALEYYYKSEFFYINLGDSEELWENLFVTVKNHNMATFKAERKFLDRGTFIKIFGNHDLYWDNDPLAKVSLESIYGKKMDIYEGVILATNAGKKDLQIFMTHGHQGDRQSDGNWFSKWFVSDIWGPFQAYLRINPNTPSTNDQLKTDHNRIMYQWSSKRKNLLLITGHTHQPVFKSFTEIEILYQKLEAAKKANDTNVAKDIQQRINKRHAKGDTVSDFTGYLDTYFNTGCCCFDDGDITGIEIEKDTIRLIKWHYRHGSSERIILEEEKLENLKIG